MLMISTNIPDVMINNLVTTRFTIYPGASLSESNPLSKIDSVVQTKVVYKWLHHTSGKKSQVLSDGAAPVHNIESYHKARLTPAIKGGKSLIKSHGPEALDDNRQVSPKKPLSLSYLECVRTGLSQARLVSDPLSEKMAKLIERFEISSNNAVIQGESDKSTYGSSSQ